MKMNIASGSLWVAYTLTDPQTIQSMLPPSLRLTSCSLLDDERSTFPTPKLLFNAYRVDAGAFMQGMRTDVLTLAQNRRTGKRHLVMLDCLTDTIQWDPIHGVRCPNARVYEPLRVSANDFALVVTNNHNLFRLRATRSVERPINNVFAVEANLACYYKTSDEAYPMSFDNDTISRPVRQLNPYDHVNTYWCHVRSPFPSHTFCHEHPMTFDVKISSFR